MSDNIHHENQPEPGDPLLQGEAEFTKSLRRAQRAALEEDQRVKKLAGVQKQLADQALIESNRFRSQTTFDAFEFSTARARKRRAEEQQREREREERRNLM